METRGDQETHPVPITTTSPKQMTKREMDTIRVRYDATAWKKRKRAGLFPPVSCYLLIFKVTLHSDSRRNVEQRLDQTGSVN